MITDTKIINIINEIVSYLISDNFAQLAIMDLNKSNYYEQIKHVVQGYPGQITPIPQGFLESCNEHYFYIWYSKDHMEANIDVALWYDNQPSDLTMQIKVMKENDDILWSIYDVRVQ